MLSAAVRITGFALLAVGVGFLLGQAEPQDTRLVFLSVGQGDCALLSSGGRNILFDAGPANERYDAGERIVIPKLRQLKVQQIDMIVLSHPDSDHMGGTQAILKAYPNALVAMSEQFRAKPEVQAQRWKHVVWLKHRGIVKFGKTTIHYLSPVPHGDDNSGSVMVRIDHGGATAVLTGDADAMTEEHALTEDNWGAQVLEVGHHGSRTSSSPTWLDAVKPEIAVVSVGRRNNYHHPNKEALSRYANRKIPIARTDQAGDIVFVARNGRFVRVK